MEGTNSSKNSDRLSLKSTASTVSTGREIKNKVLNVWHKIKFGKAAWNFDPSSNSNFDSIQPVWLLGLCYHRRIDEEESQIPIARPYFAEVAKDAFLKSLW